MAGSEEGRVSECARANSLTAREAAWCPGILSHADAASRGGPVVPAGPREMDIKPKGWSRTDEELDESFPASDPPGNY